MMQSTGAADEDQKWSARFPVYQMDFTSVAAGKRIATSKRRVKWRFGFSNADAIDAGQTGTSCRGREHDVTIVWSISSGKRLILVDGQEVHYSTVRSNVLEHSWTMKGNHVLKVLAYAVPSKDVAGARQYDLSVDGQSFFHMPKVFELGLKGPPSALARTPGVISAADRTEIAPPSSKRQERDDLQKAIEASLEESRSHLQRTAIGDDEKAPATEPPKVDAITPAPAPEATKASDYGDLLDFGFDTAPVSAPSSSMVSSIAAHNSSLVVQDDPFLSALAPAPAQTQAASSSASSLLDFGGFDSAPTPAPVPAPQPADNPFAQLAVSEPAAPQSAVTELAGSQPAASQPVASEPAAPQLTVSEPAASQSAVDPFTASISAPAASMTQSLISNEPSGLFDMFGTNEQTVASPDPTEQLSGLVQGGTQTDNPSAPQPTTETTVASIETSAIQGTGLDSAMNKLVDINDIFGKKEEQPTLSMKPLEGPEKDKSPTNGLRSSITFAGPQPTLAQMKTVKTSNDKAPIMDPDASTASLIEIQPPSYSNYSQGPPLNQSLSQSQGLMAVGQMQAEQRGSFYGMQPQTQGYNYGQPQTQFQQQQQQQPPTAADNPFSAFG
mmetsp:Transcript_69095/g.102675  ORF Transcript_69095/g.102675 Transcript_69095/m.102675 type:complete len:612 (+) Transcript_69095:121-1956(+)